MIRAPRARPEATISGVAKLQVEHLSFTYPDTSRRVLDDVTLDITTGEVVALVGENGSGADAQPGRGDLPRLRGVRAQGPREHRHGPTRASRRRHCDRSRGTNLGRARLPHRAPRRLRHPAVPRAEVELFATIRTLAAGRTVLLISHRFSSVRAADRIFVLDHGRLTTTP